MAYKADVKVISLFKKKKKMKNSKPQKIITTRNNFPSLRKQTKSEIDQKRNEKS